MIRIIILFPQLLLIVALAAVSGYCEISLFVDFAETGNDLDTIQMGALAGSLVLAQHTLAQRAGSLAARGHTIAAWLVGVVVLALLVISVSASAVFYEARYQASSAADRQAGTGYQLREQLITDQQDSIQNLKALAATEEAKGNTWIAGQHQIKAQQIQDTLPGLISELDKVQTPVTSSAGIIDSLLADYRWFVWLAFGLIPDLIPMLLLVLLTVYPERKHQKKQPDSEGQPDPDPVAENDQQTAEPDQPATLTTLIARMGKMPTWQEVKARGISYRQYKKQRDVLEREGMVFNPGDGTGFQLAAMPGGGV